MDLSGGTEVVLSMGYWHLLVKSSARAPWSNSPRATLSCPAGLGIAATAVTKMAATAAAVILNCILECEVEIGVS